MKKQKQYNKSNRPRKFNNKEFKYAGHARTKKQAQKVVNHQFGPPHKRRFYYRIIKNKKPAMGYNIYNCRK